MKTYGPRGTVHLVPATDLAAWCAGLAAAPWAASRLPPSVRMSPEQVDLVVEAVDAALADADLTVDELDGPVVRRTGPWAGELVVPGFDGWWPRWRQVIPMAAYRGVLCFGPDRARRTTYTSPRRWVPGFQGVSAAHGLPDLVLGYLRSYGPATIEQVAQWLGVPASGLRRAVATLADELVEVDLARRAPPFSPLRTPAPTANSTGRSTTGLACCPTSTRTSSAVTPGRRSSPETPRCGR